MTATRFYRWITVLLIISAPLILSSCKKDKHKVDLSNIEIDVDLKRYEDDIFNVKSLEDYLALDSIDPVFFSAYKNGIIGDVTGVRLHASPQAQFLGYKDFITHPDMQDLYKQCEDAYPNMEPYREDFEKAFSYYNYHFPKKEIPTIITFISPFRYATVLLEGRLCIGLDMYLGPDFEPYRTPSLQFTEYLIRKMKPDMIVPNGMKAWLMSEFLMDETDKRFINRIVYEGKILYLMDAMFPDMNDSLKIGYLNGQIEWNRENEAQIWQNIVENDLLYSTDETEYVGLLHDGPFSKGVNVPQESSPRIGIWAGWQIVRKYMDRHPETSLKELMEIEDPGVILKGSVYKP